MFMDKKLMGVLGAASTLALLAGGAAAATPTEASGLELRPAQSFAELLDPIPNAIETLKAEDQKGPPATESSTEKVAQYYYHHHHHHQQHYYYHHHHQHYYYHHHHHHQYYHSY
jgi:hypothetical protein